MDDLLHFSKVVLPATLEPFRQLDSTPIPNCRPPAAGLATVDEPIAQFDRLGSATLRAERSAGGLTGNHACAGVGASVMNPLGGDDQLELGLRVVAFSMGGLIATFAAVQDPALFRKVRFLPRAGKIFLTLE